MHATHSHPAPYMRHTCRRCPPVMAAGPWRLAAGHALQPPARPPLPPAGAAGCCGAALHARQPQQAEPLASSPGGDLRVACMRGGNSGDRKRVRCVQVSLCGCHAASACEGHSQPHGTSGPWQPAARDVWHVHVWVCCVAGPDGQHHLCHASHEAFSLQSSPLLVLERTAGRAAAAALPCAATALSTGARDRVWQRRGSMSASFTCGPACSVAARILYQLQLSVPGAGRPQHLVVCTRAGREVCRRRNPLGTVRRSSKLRTWALLCRYAAAARSSSVTDACPFTVHALIK